MWGYSRLIGRPDGEFSETIAGDAKRFTAWQRSAQGKRAIEQAYREFNSACDKQGIYIKRASAKRYAVERQAAAAADRSELRRLYWLRLTGTEPTLELLANRKFRDTAPETLLMNCAALRMHFCDGSVLADAPSWSWVASALQRTLPRVAWLKSRGVPGPLNLHSVLKTKDAEFSIRYSGVAATYTAWRGSPEGEAAFSDEKKALDAFIRTLGLQAPKQLLEAGMPATPRPRGDHSENALKAASETQLSHWRILVGADASDNLQQKAWFRAMTPETLLVNGATLLMHLCDGERLAAAPSWLRKATPQRVLPRISWLQASGVPRPWQMSAVVLGADAAFSARFNDDPGAYSAWRASAGGASAIAKQYVELAAMIRSLGCAVPKQLQSALRSARTRASGVRH